MKNCFSGPNALPDPSPYSHLSLSVDDCVADAYVWRIGGTKRNLENWAKQFANDVIEHMKTVGGDDSYYDYFPNYVDMFYAVCRELDLKKLYCETIDIVLSGRYVDDDEENITKWSD